MKKTVAVTILALVGWAACAYEVKQITQETEVRADDPFEFCGATCAGAFVITFLPSTHFTEASLDMLGENSLDRLEEIEVALREAPDRPLRDADIPGAEELARAVAKALSLISDPDSTPTLNTNGELVEALEQLGLALYPRRRSGDESGSPRRCLDLRRLEVCRQAC